MIDIDSYPVWLVLLGLVAAYYLGLPLIIILQQRFPACPRLVELDFKRLDSRLAKFLQKQTETLFALGFDESTLVQIVDAAPRVSSYLVMLVSRRTGDKAMVTALVGHGPVTLRMCYVEFSTRFHSGEVFDTHNAPEIPAFPPAPLAVRTQVPMVKDLRELLQLHTFVMNKHEVREQKFLYEPGKALDYLIEYAFVKSYDVQVKRGWLKYDPAKNEYRPTLKGGYLITWGLMQPFKALRMLALRRRAGRILDEFHRTRVGATGSA